MDMLPDFLRATAALAATLALLVILAWLGRRYGSSIGLNTPAARGTSHLKVADKLTLGPSTTLYVVEDEEHRHLIATHAQQITLLHTNKLREKTTPAKSVIRKKP